MTPEQIRAQVCDRGIEAILAHPRVGMPAYAKIENAARAGLKPGNYSEGFGKGSDKRVGVVEERCAIVLGVLDDRWRTTPEIAAAVNMDLKRVQVAMARLLETGRAERGLRLTEGQTWRAIT